MQEPKFKLGDKVRTDDGLWGIVAGFEHKTGKYRVDVIEDDGFAVFLDIMGWFSPYQLTLIEPVNNSSRQQQQQQNNNTQDCGNLLDSQQEAVVPNTLKTGFDPENLTFDGRKIMEGDEVETEQGRYVVIRGNLGYHAVLMTVENDNRCRTKVYMRLKLLNITAHYPKAKTELEEAENELENANRNLVNYVCTSLDGATEEALDRYYQARKKVEEFKSKND